MEFLALISLEVCAFNTAITRPAEGSIKLVVVLFTVREIVEHVKVSRLERCPASLANKALLMVTAGQSAVSSFDRFSGDGF